MGGGIHHHYPRIDPRPSNSIPCLSSPCPPSRSATISDFVVLWWLLCRYRYLPCSVHQVMSVPTGLLHLSDRRSGYLSCCGRGNRWTRGLGSKDARLALGSKLRFHPIYDLCPTSIQSTSERSHRASSLPYETSLGRKQYLPRRKI